MSITKAATGQFAPPTTQFAPPATAPPSSGHHRHHVNQVSRAADVRARDEQQMQNLLQQAQFEARIYNTDIEPEHETEYVCNCSACRYRGAKIMRRNTHDIWSKAVKYPGEKTYNDITWGTSGSLFTRNPYINSVTSPFGPVWQRGNSSFYYTPAQPKPHYYTQNIHQTIALNNRLNKEAQAAVDAMEPKVSIWKSKSNEPPSEALAGLQLDSKGEKGEKGVKGSREKAEVPPTYSAPPGPPPAAAASAIKPKRQSGFFGKLLKSSEPKASEVERNNQELANSILAEEAGRWADDVTRAIVVQYQEKTGMTRKIAHLRETSPIQYLHLLRAGYFEPIPTAWADLTSNPLKFSIEAAGGWRGITPAWRGFEDTAEERLYWVLNHREGTNAVRLKPDYISEMNMARDRMARAVEPPPEYFSPDDQCHVQHKSDGYSKQVMPPEFRPFDRPEMPTDDTMILLDVSGSMDFDPLRPIYTEYLITGYSASTQPKNKDVAKAIVRRFTDAMAHHDHIKSGYDLITFSSAASYIGRVTHRNFDEMWNRVAVGGGTRVMTGWSKCKEKHFQKHRETATWHPIFGWQAGPETPMLRLLLLLDGEATDMDEFELDLLGLSWAHVTIFLIGVDGCPHHHRHANELQRISDVNHHVSFVDAQGNTPERFVTHELLKRHLGINISLSEFTELEQLPAYEI